MTSAELAGIDPLPGPAGAVAPGKGGRTQRGALARYLLVRLVLIVPTVLILVTVVFFLMRVVGDPVTAALGGRLNPAQIAERKAAAGLDRPILTQYWEYLTALLRGDFGKSFTDSRPISDVVIVNGQPPWS